MTDSTDTPQDPRPDNTVEDDRVDQDVAADTNADEILPVSVRCEPRKDPAVRSFIAAGIFLGMSAWCIYDIVGGVKTYADPGEDWNQFLGWAFNFFIPFLAVPGGLYLLFKALAMLKRVLVADAEGIGYESKDKLFWDAVTTVDASDLRAKKILRLEYGDDDVMVLDSWYLQDFAELVKVVERYIPEDKYSFGDEDDEG